MRIPGLFAAHQVSRITTNGGTNWTNIGLGEFNLLFAFTAVSSAPAPLDENFDGTVFLLQDGKL
jgi:hypothetical protein